MSDAPQTPPPQAPDRGMRWVLLLIAISLLWYLLADRFTPYTQQARLQAYVVPVSAEVAGPVKRVAVGNNQEVRQGAVLFELDLAAVLARPVPVFQAVSRHQQVERDLAIVVHESVTHDAVIEAIHAIGSPWLREAALFDVYRPKAGAPAGSLQADEKSLAVRIVLNRDDATLTEDDIEATIQAALASLQQRTAARLRTRSPTVQSP